MAEPYAEVIGDPVAHSLSPAIHRHWLAALGLPGDYRATRVTSAELPTYLAERRTDPAWRGCNVTMPLKREAARSAGRNTLSLARDAANCLTPEAGILTAHNTDIDGIHAALANIDVAGRRVVIIGSGGAAAAVRIALADAEIATIRRDRSGRFPDGAPDTIASAALVINATPLGMIGAPAMPADIVTALSRMAPGASAFDMVYQPLETPFLAAARATGLQTIDGLTMLIGQARRSFELFFGVAPPPGDAELRRLLLRAG